MSRAHGSHTSSTLRPASDARCQMNVMCSQVGHAHREGESSLHHPSGARQWRGPV